MTGNRRWSNPTSLVHSCQIQAPRRAAVTCMNGHHDKASMLQNAIRWTETRGASSARMTSLWSAMLFTSPCCVSGDDGARSLYVPITSCITALWHGAQRRRAVSARTAVDPQGAPCCATRLRTIWSSHGVFRPPTHVGTERDTGPGFRARRHRRILIMNLADLMDLFR